MATASLVCWESGAFSAEVLDVRSEQYRCSRIGEFIPGQPLTDQLAHSLAALCFFRNVHITQACRNDNAFAPERG
jgi:hypothetical protein